MVFLGGDRALEITENLTWGGGSRIRTETFMLFIKCYCPNALTPTGLKKTTNKSHHPPETGFFQKTRFLKAPCHQPTPSPTNNPSATQTKISSAGPPLLKGGGGGILQHPLLTEVAIAPQTAPFRLKL